MAEKIKGIIVTIGGDTSGLDKALSGTNREIADTQSELKKVERLLKLDPKNTVLLEQKQTLLTKAVADTSGKLNTLKEVEQQVQEQFKSGKIGEEQYREFQRELVSTKQSAKDLQKQLDESAQKFDYLGTKAEKVNGAMKVAGLGMVGIGAGLVGMAVKAGQAADDINTLAKQTGLSTAEIQKFQYAADIIDVPLETLTGSMAKLTKNMATAQKGTGDAATAFHTLGVQIVNTDGSLRNNQDVFDETILKLGRMENETQRDAMAMQIFGKSAQDLNPLILGGAEALKQLGDEAEAAGLILSQEALDGTNAFNDGVDRLKAKSTAALAAVGGQIAEKILPHMETLIEGVSKLIQWILNNGDAVITVITSIGAGLAAFNVVVMIQGLIKAFQAWKLATDGVALSQLLLNMAMSVNPIALIVAAIAALVAALVVLWNTNDDFRAAITETWQAICDTISGIADFIVSILTERIPQAIDGMVSAFRMVSGVILTCIKAPFNMAISLINNVVDAINRAIQWMNSLTLPAFLGGGSLGISIGTLPKLPMLAKGGTVLQGSVVVGEAGPELMTMTGGRAIVQPLSGPSTHAAATPTYVTNHIQINPANLAELNKVIKIMDGERRSIRMGYAGR